jgi:hypothetical protein
MMRLLLIRGLLVGALAGLLAFGVARILGEPQVDRAIAFEEQMSAAESAPATSAGQSADAGMSMAPAAAADHSHEGEDELVSRSTQAGLGLLTATVAYGAAFGGLFSLVFGFVQGRVSRFRPRVTAALLAGAAFLTVYLVPSLKYPANPPAASLGETIGYRSGLFVTMIALTILAMIVAVRVAQHVVKRHGGWNAALMGAGVFLVLVIVAELVMPTLNETPEGFPSTLLWDFRIASIGIQVVMWATIGTVFGAVTEKLFGSRPRTA